MEVNGYEIEEVELPKRKGRGAILSYPIAALEANSKQSFIQQVGESTVKNVKASIRQFAKRNGYTVSLAEEIKEGQEFIRVWRTRPVESGEPVTA
jgi:hypothetical protein